MKKKFAKTLTATTLIAVIGTSTVFADDATHHTHQNKNNLELVNEKENNYLIDICELLEIDEEELKQRINNGENIYDLLIEKGKLEEFKKLQLNKT